MNSYWDGTTSETSTGTKDHIKTDLTVPAGFYVCEVIDFGAWRSKTDEAWNAKWTLTIIEGAQRGKHLVRWSSMTKERAQRNHDLFQNTLGELPVFDVDHGFADYDAIRKSINGAIVKVKTEPWKSNGKGGINVYINQLTAKGGGVDAAPATPTVPMDEIPF